MRWLAAIFLSLFLIRDASAQDIIARNINTDDGLPSSEVYSIIQDSAGFIWIGTDNGLARYDGKSFKVFSTKDGLPDNTVLRLNQDEDGKIWLTTLSKDIVYYHEGEFHPFDYSFSDSIYGRRYEVPVPIGTDSAGRLVIESLLHTIMAMDDGNHTFSCFTGEPFGIPAHEANSVFETIKVVNGQRVAHEKVSRRDPMPKEFSVEDKGDFYIINGPFDLSHTTPGLYYHRRMNSGRVVSINGHGHYVVSNRDSVFESGYLEAKPLNHIYVQPNGDVWVCSRTGAWRFQNEDFQKPEHFLKGQFNTGVLLDKEGNYWFTDHNKGMWVTNNIHFRKLKVPASSDDFRIAEIKVRNGTLWFSSIDGHIWNIDANETLSFVYEDKRRTYDVYPFEVGRNGDLILPNGLKLGSNGKTKLEGDRIGFERDKAIVRYGDHFLVATSLGIAGRHADGHWNYASHDIINDSVRFDTIQGRWSERCNAILVENESDLWLGTLNGLFRKSDGRYSKVAPEDSLLQHRIMALAHIDKNHIAIGTKGAGLLIYNKSNHDVLQVDERLGLTSDMVRSICVKGSKIYVGTNRGLNLVNLNTDLSFRNVFRFNIHNGLESNEVNSIASFNNKIWLATGKGVIYVNEDKLVPNTWAPPIFITGVQANDSNIAFESGYLDLKVSQRYLTFSYNGVAYRAGNRVKYKYILSGFDPDTTFTGNSLARYTNLSPGEYTFRVWAQNEDGFWSEQPATISFIVPHKFTETWVYTLTWLLLLISVGSMIFYYFYRRKQDKLAIELKTSELKQQALAALMNPHFIYNSLSAIQHFINTDNGEKSNLYLSRFAKLVRQNLNAVRNGFVVLEDEIERLQLYLEIEHMRFGDKLSYELILDETMDDLTLEIPSMILQPFVENAIWHGILPQDRQGYIEIMFHMYSYDILEVLITDNGPGIENSENEEKPHHTSMSMDITRERLKLLGKKTGKEYAISITDIDTEEGGTQVYLQIPVR